MTRPQRTSKTGKYLALFCTVILVAAGGGFGYKLFEFIRNSLEGELTFAIVHVTTYIVVAMGFVLMFVAAVLGGQLKDVEGPKYRMLEQEAELDAQEGS